MNNKNNFSYEELKLSLPDYINKEIKDVLLFETIQKELETSVELKKEYEELKYTFDFIENAEFSSPPDNYFNNLSVKINEKINYSNADLSWWERLSPVWKFLIPALPVIIFAFYFLFNFYNNENTGTEIVKENSPVISLPEPPENKKETVPETELKKENITDIKENTENKVNAPVVLKNKKMIHENYVEKTPALNTENSIYLNNNEPVSENDENKSELDENSLDLLNGDLFAGKLDLDFVTDYEADTDNDEESADLLYQADLNDDKEIEDELTGLTAEEKNEILDNLKSY